MTPEWITAAVAVIALVGGGIWTAVNYFASNRYADALEEGLKEIKREFGELKELVTTHISNETYYRMHIEEQKEMLKKYQETVENADLIFKQVDSKLKRISA